MQKGYDMDTPKPEIVTGYAKVWPRSVFDTKAANKLVPEIRALLHEPVVYIPYRGDQL